MKCSLSCIFLGVVLVDGCVSRPPGRDASRPVFGGNHESRFVIATDRELGLHELAKMAKVIGPYRQLTQAEVRQIKARLRRWIDDLVMDEEKDIEEEQRRTPERRQLSKPEIHGVAMTRVLARLGKDLALPVVTSDNRSVVAFGSIQDETVEVTSTAYEIDTPPAQLKPGSEVTQLDGTKATLIDDTKKR